MSGVNFTVGLDGELIVLNHVDPPAPTGVAVSPDNGLFGRPTVSTTQNAVGIGILPFTLDVDDGSITTDYTVSIFANGEPDVFMYGIVTAKTTSVSPAQITVSVFKCSDVVGTYNDWTIQVIQWPFTVANLVDNPAFNIWQRGTSFTIASSTKTAVADRWKFYRGAAGATVSRQTGFNGSKYCPRAARDSGNSSTVALRLWHQLHESVARGLANRTVILSFDVRCGANYSGTNLSVRIHTGTGGGEAADLSQVSSAAFATGGAVTSVSSTVTPTTNAQRVTCAALLLGSSVADLAFQITWTPSGTAGAADYIEIINVKLSACPVDTPFTPPKEADDWAACAYTFRAVGAGLTATAQTTTTMTVAVQLSPAMRVTPTAALLTDYGVLISNATKSSSGGVIIIAAGDTVGYRVGTDGFTGLTAGQAGVVISSPAFTFDAELL